MPGAVMPSQMRQAGPTRGSEGPDASLLDIVPAAFRTSQDTWTEAVTLRKVEAYGDLARSLIERGVPREQLVRADADGLLHRWARGGHEAFDFDADKVWLAVEAARQNDEKALPGVPKTRAEYDQFVLRRRGARDSDLSTLSRARGVTGTVASVIGGSAADMADSDLGPLQFMIGGGGKNIAQAFLREGTVAAIEEGLKQPERIANAEQLGEQTSTEQIALDIGGSFLFAGALGAGGKYLSDNWDAVKAAPADLQEKAWAGLLERSPALRDKVGAKVNWDALDDHLPDVAEALVPPERMTTAERGAINLLRRESSIDAGNPFVPDGAGVESHYRLLGETIQGIVNESPVYVPKGRPNPAARLRGSTSVASGVAPIADAPGDFDLPGYLARNRSAESGGNDAAKAETSSAYGRYQFLKETWVRTYKDTFGDTGETRAQILRKRADGAVQDKVMATFTNANRRAIARAGFVADDGNSYLAHFLGVGDAIKVLRAAPDAPVRGLVSNASINANPAVFRKITTASELQAWAKRKMGGKGAAVPARGDSARPAADDGTVLAALDQQLAATEADLARLDGEIDAGAADVRAITGDLADDLAPEPMAPADAIPRVADDPLPDLRGQTARDNELAGMTAAARAIMPDLRRIVDGERSVSLNRPGPLAERLGVDERNLQLALQQMAVDGLLVRSAKGTFSRLPQRKSGPQDVFTFLAARGGLNTKGFSQATIERNKYADNPPQGHDLGTIFQVEREVVWRRRPDANGMGGIKLDQPYRTTRPVLIPGYGPLVRESGMGLDEAGELLWEEGFFGPPDMVARPTETEVIELLQNAFGSGSKVYSFYDQAEVADRIRAEEMADPNNPFKSDFQSEEHYRYEWGNFDHVAEVNFGITLDEEAFEAAWRIYRASDDGDMASAVLQAIQREIEDVQARELADLGLDDADKILTEWEDALRGSGIAGREEIPSGRFDPGDTGPDDAAFRNSFGEEASGPIDPETWAHWDEPDGASAKLTTESMEHDARVAVGRLGTLSDEGELDGGERLLSYVSADGQRSDIIIKIDGEGIAEISVDGLAATFADEAGRAGGANRFGPAVIRDAMAQLRQLFPEIRQVKGDRLTGAGVGRVQRIEFSQAGEIGAPSLDLGGRVDPNAAARTRQELDLRAQQPLRGDRKTGQAQADIMPQGLFGGPEEAIFRLDEEGDVIDPADLLAEFDDDAAFLKNIRDCL